VRTIPLFPLPGVVLFPGTLLPLHIFEPRYRALVAHALESDRLIGMAMISGDIPEEILGLPPIHALGGAGTIVEHERLADGRYNIILEGTFRFRILREEGSRPFRTATVEEAPTDPFPSGAEEQTALAIALRVLPGTRLLAQVTGLHGDAEVFRAGPIEAQRAGGWITAAHGAGKHGSRQERQAKKGEHERTRRA